MKIEVLGPGCARCKKQAAFAQKAVRESGVDAEILKVTDLEEIAKRGLVFTPVVVIDGEVKSSGRVASVDELQSWIKQSETSV